VIYERCGVEGGVGLGRLVAETDALARLAAATDVEILAPGGGAAPLRFVRRRRAPGRIAVEDHGPAGGRPVVVFHTPTSGRHLPRRLVAAMHARGLRPIAVERPGFGLTSPSEEDAAEAANADLVDVLDDLGLRRVLLLCRSLAMPFRFAASHPSRVEGGVLIAPTPPGTVSGHGLLATAMRMAMDHPRMAAGLARMMARLSSERAIMRLTERALGDSPTDMAALRDEANRADWVRASRQGAMGDGLAREFVLHGGGGKIPELVETLPWVVMIGGQDSMGLSAGDGAALWRAAMPGVRVERVADAGRLMVMTHPDLVAATLEQIDRL
jgi:pimeloyl-ACP methyl ester carboxylesterase